MEGNWGIRRHWEWHRTGVSCLFLLVIPPCFLHILVTDHLYYILKNRHFVFRVPRALHLLCSRICALGVQNASNLHSKPPYEAVDEITQTPRGVEVRRMSEPKRRSAIIPAVTTKRGMRGL